MRLANKVALITGGGSGIGEAMFPLPGEAQEIDIEQILPRPSAERTRLNFGQTEVTQCQGTQSSEQRARRVLGCEDDRRLPGNIPGCWSLRPRRT